ncbi:MAG: undecaprenyl-diphosphate phosphatase [Brevibacterium aurantiacum]|uniref:Undecaprenyl-diphosphatase n=1 Tax=Brevibacterium aurantiacum TaxID=273384 RepID=A0A1D7W498_BREAU|nr:MULTISPECIES: undecaprenyl-diphosphate phosphatase [Brevibacterium]MDN5550431.1 undecaprenyl-diphosphate phosphatase [Brevibacterium sp.]AOP53802.1 Undecaprenyl-diphosphatase [Brevibacterium aurantiacum]AZL09483.1 undecaprenyl-diphosphate phosphatase [Brevibacterium aurantiacum]AZT93608.1 undecaprenyl-diphosphate phosphatase [Brevibacterium aurantiacum]AZT97395.1 undecaprenyl-diphosphate phosphatase [Brevibacterium aurantiacum]
MYDWLVAAVLGIVQALTEFLPISSSAHVRIVGEFMLPGQDPGAFFTAIIQIGTEAAVVVYFWRDIVSIISKWCKALVGKHDRKDPEVRLGWLIIVGSIPIVILGLLFQDAIEGALRSLWITATMLIVFGLIIGLADWVGKKERTLEDMTWGQGIAYGFAQALALIPGVSRSGGTIMAGRFMGFDRPAAARYSFLLAIPAVLGSGFYSVFQTLGSTDMVIGWGPTILATIIAFGLGLLVIHWFLGYVKTKSFAIFVWYRVALGLVLYVLLGTGVLAAT